MQLSKIGCALQTLVTKRYERQLWTVTHVGSDYVFDGYARTPDGSTNRQIQITGAIICHVRQPAVMNGCPPASNDWRNVRRNYCRRFLTR